MRPFRISSASTAAMNRSISTRQASGDPSLKRYLMRKCFIGFSFGAQGGHRELWRKPAPNSKPRRPVAPELAAEGPFPQVRTKMTVWRWFLRVCRPRRVAAHGGSSFEALCLRQRAPQDEVGCMPRSQGPWLDWQLPGISMTAQRLEATRKRAGGELARSPGSARSSHRFAQRIRVLSASKNRSD